MDKNNQLSKLSQTGGTITTLTGAIKQEIKTGISIRSLQNPEPIKTALKYVFVLVGLKPEQMPDVNTTNVLVSFIREKYGNYTANEIKIAFEMAVKGDFESDLEHFGNFSPLYFSKVFNAYTAHRNKIALEIERERLKNEQIESEEEKQKQIEAFKAESLKIYRESDLEFNGTKFHANVLYPMLKEFFTREELVQFKKTAGAQLHRLQKEYEEKKKYGQVMVGELATVSFTQSEWKKRTALITVQEAIKRGIEL